MKYKIPLPIVILIIWSVQFLYAQPDTLWTRTYGGSAMDEAACVLESTEGGYVVLGTSEQFLWIIRVDGKGDTLWTKTYSESNEAAAIRQTPDSGYIVVGNTTTEGGDPDIWLAKTDAMGDTLWTRTIGGDLFPDYSFEIETTSDSGYIIAGSTASFGAEGMDLWLTRTNAQGDTLWKIIFGGSDDEIGMDIVETTQGDIIVVGGVIYSQIFTADAIVVKTNADGDTLWTRIIGGDGWDMFTSVQITFDGSYLIAGGTSSFGADNSDLWLMKIGNNGDVIWTKTIGGSGSDGAMDIKMTADGGYVLVGDTDSFGAGGYDIWIVKINASGDTLWTKTFGYSGNDRGISIEQTTDQGYIVVGNTGSIVENTSDIVLIRLEPDTSGIVSIVQTDPFIKGGLVLPQNYPNPFNPSTLIQFELPEGSEIRLVVYDLLGREIIRLVGGHLGVGYHRVVWDGTDSAGREMPSGVYIARLVTPQYIRSIKLVLLK